MSGYRAKKRLGQNFLKSQSVIDQMIELIDPGPGERIIEIGPGRGALTAALAASGANITAVEFDRDLIGYLTKLVGHYDNVEILNEDFLAYKPTFDGFKLVGNIPYNITSPVVDWAVSHTDRIDRGYLMIQKEMAQRLASSPGSKDWSPIAILTQLHFDIATRFDVSPKHFQPPPSVVSTVIELIAKPTVEIADYDKFAELVRAAFSQRRKTLVNNLVPHLTEDRQMITGVIESLGLADRIRAEEISTAQFLELTELLVSRNLF